MRLKNTYLFKQGTLSLFFLLYSVLAMAQIPNATIQSHSNVKPDGYFFIAPYKINAKSAKEALLNKAMILNTMGEVICYRNVPIGNDFKLHPNGTISLWNGTKWLILNSSLQIIDSVSCVNGIETDNHDFLILANGHYLLIGKQSETKDLSAKKYFNQLHPIAGSKRAKVKYDVIQELDKNKKLVYQWNSKDHFKLEDADRFYLTDTATVDVTHFNSIDVDAEGSILVSARFFNEVFKINKKTGSIMWRLGGKYNTLTLLNNPKSFLGQHDARFTGQNTFTLFDNGHTYDSLKQNARVLEYEINETLKTAKVIGEYSNPGNIYSQAAGNVQRIKNGYTLVNYGKTKQGGQNVTLEMLDGKNNKILTLFYTDTMASYRAYYYETCPVISEQPELKLTKKNGISYITPVNSYKYCLWNTGQTDKEIEFVAGKVYYVFLSNDNTVYIRSKSKQAKP
jgi:hypothetical protein